MSDVECILFVAAEPMELRGMLKRCHRVRPLAWPVRFAREGELNGARIIALAHGPGRRLAREAIDAALDRVRPRAIVSTGFCGGLHPDFASGDVFVASAVAGPEGARFESRRPSVERRFHTGVLATTDSVARAIVEKQTLRDAGAAAVDMEAEAVARAAREAAVPFYCVRAVLDAAGRELFLDFNAARGDTGRFSRMRLLKAALARPGRGLPELWWLAAAGREASRSLGDFLARCRF